MALIFIIFLVALVFICTGFLSLMMYVFPLTKGKCNANADNK